MTEGQVANVEVSFTVRSSGAPEEVHFEFHPGQPRVGLCSLATCLGERPLLDPRGTSPLHSTSSTP